MQPRSGPVGVAMVGALTLLVASFGVCATALGATNPHGAFASGTQKCKVCHTPHAAAGPSIVNSSTVTALCVDCHDGTVSTLDVAREIGMGDPSVVSSHPVGTAALGSCASCHTPHNGPAEDNAMSLAAGPSRAKSGNAVCAACHGSGASAPLKDLLAEYADSGHGSRLAAPTAGARIQCLVCHEPHGSSNESLVARQVRGMSGTANTIAVSASTGPRPACEGCHDTGLGRFGGPVAFGISKHGTVAVSTVAAVTWPAAVPATNAGGCDNCHLVHGSGNAYATREVSNALCSTCHDAAGTSKPAGYSYRGSATYAATPHATTTDTVYKRLRADSAGFEAWEASSQPTPGSPGTVLDPVRRSALLGMDDSRAVTRLATVDGGWDCQLYRAKVDVPADAVALTAVWKGRGDATYLTDARPITIIGSTSGPLTDYQVLVTVDTSVDVSAGRMRSDGADIRFIGATGAYLPYWIESGMNTASTRIWVKVDSIPDGDVAPPGDRTTVLMVFGDPGASPESSGKATMAFFDDFSTVDPGWTNASISGGVMRIGGGVNNGASHALGGVTPGRVAIEYDYAFGTTGGIYQGGRNWFGDSYLRPDVRLGGLFLNSYTPVAPAIQGVTWGTTSHHVGMWWGGGATDQFSMGVDGAVVTGTLPDGGKDVADLVFSLDGIWTGPSTIDNIHVRKFALPEPAVSVGGSGRFTVAYPTSISLWNRTYGSGAGGWEELRSFRAAGDTTTKATRYTPSSYVDPSGYVYLLAKLKSRSSTSSLEADFVAFDVGSVGAGGPVGACATCHAVHGATDANGALVPGLMAAREASTCLGTGSRPCHSSAANSAGGVDIYARFTAGTSRTSYHDVLIANEDVPGGKIKCSSCHNPHKDTAAAKYTDPDDVAGTTPTMRGFCLRCHDGSPPADIKSAGVTDIATAWADDYHGEGSGAATGFAGTLSAPYARGQQAIPCETCHDPHGTANLYHIPATVNGSAVTGIVSGVDLQRACAACHAGDATLWHSAQCNDCHAAATAAQSNEHQPGPIGPTSDCAACHAHGRVWEHYDRPVGNCHCRPQQYWRTF